MYCLFESLWSGRIALTGTHFKKAILCLLMRWNQLFDLFFSMEIFAFVFPYHTYSVTDTATVVLLFELTNRPTLRFAWLLSMWFYIFYE